jgi:serine/threonine-protein kinase HipA
MAGRLSDFRHVETLRVDIALDGVPRPVGRMAWRQSEFMTYFEFDRAFLDDPLPISPFGLPAKPGVFAATRGLFEGVHGLFNDSLPDGWGRKLLDRSLQRRGLDFRFLTPLDRLAAVGASGMGALLYHPEMPLDEAPPNGPADLDWLAGQARLAEDDVPEADVDRLRQAEGSSGGARPKIVMAYDPEVRSVRYDDGRDLPPGFSRWLLKFSSKDDPSEMGAEEYAYASMARAAGVEFPEVDLIRTRTTGYFAVRRFDRDGGARRHVHTASGLIGTDYRLAGSFDYDTLLRLTHVLTKDAREVAQMFRRMAFNVFGHNRDDHAKNHAFLMDAGGRWRLSPAYDVTFSNGPGGEHNLAVAGEGRRPGEREILKVAETASVPKGEARRIVEEVREAVRRWPEFADEAGLSARRTSEIDAAINGPGRRLGPAPDDVEAASSPSI